MDLTHDVSLPNLLIATAMFLILAGGLTYILVRMQALSRDLSHLEDRFDSLPPAIAGEVVLREEFRDWFASQRVVEAKVELLERRIEALEPNGNGHTSTGE